MSKVPLESLYSSYLKSTFFSCHIIYNWESTCRHLCPRRGRLGLLRKQAILRKDTISWHVQLTVLGVVQRLKGRAAGYRAPGTKAEPHTLGFSFLFHAASYWPVLAQLQSEDGLLQVTEEMQSGCLLVPKGLCKGKYHYWPFMDHLITPVPITSYLLPLVTRVLISNCTEVWMGEKCRDRQKVSYQSPSQALIK